MWLQEDNEFQLGKLKYLNDRYDVEDLEKWYPRKLARKLKAAAQIINN